jgi:hypothetical protein
MLPLTIRPAVVLIRTMASPQEQPGAEPCIPNINRRQRRRRLAAGLVALAFSSALLLALLFIGVSVWWRLALLPPFFAAASGVFQWRDET